MTLWYIILWSLASMYLLHIVPHPSSNQSCGLEPTFFVPQIARTLPYGSLHDIDNRVAVVHQASHVFALREFGGGMGKIAPRQDRK